jgi:hypothetical protein
MPAPTEDVLKLPQALELQRIVSEKKAAELQGVSVDTIRRKSARGELQRIQISPRRVGYRLGDVLGISA